MSFDACFDFTMKEEGGYVHRPPDPETYRGINRDAHPAWPGWHDIDARKPIARGKIFDELEPLVREFYRKVFWERHGLEAYSPPLALVLFDFYVNSGAAPRIFNELRASKGRTPTALEVIRARGHYMVDLATGHVLSDAKRIAFFTAVLPGWMRRIQKNLLTVRAMDD